MKQHAFAEIAETTFSHLLGFLAWPNICSELAFLPTRGEPTVAKERLWRRSHSVGHPGLSLDWHLRKKMGEVLRVMDRGITSADSVMSLPCTPETVALHVLNAATLYPYRL